MKDKFKMELVWHNCYSYPPSESYNEHLFVTDGNEVFETKYIKGSGWFDYDKCEFLPPELLWKYWWADIERTIRGDVRYD